MFNIIILYQSIIFYLASNAEEKLTAPSSDYSYKLGTELLTTIQQYPTEMIPTKDSAADTNLYGRTTKYSIDPVYPTASTTYVIPSKETSPSYIEESSITTSAAKEMTTNENHVDMPKNAPQETAPGYLEEKPNVWQKPEERETNSSSHGGSEGSSSQTPTKISEEAVSVPNYIEEKPNIESKQEGKEAIVIPYGASEASSSQPTPEYPEENKSDPKNMEEKPNNAPKVEEKASDSIPVGASEGTSQTPPKFPEENARDDPSRVEMTEPPITGKYILGTLMKGSFLKNLQSWALYNCFGYFLYTLFVSRPAN